MGLRDCRIGLVSEKFENNMDKITLYELSDKDFFYVMPKLYYDEGNKIQLKEI